MSLRARLTRLEQHNAGVVIEYIKDEDDPRLLVPPGENVIRIVYVVPVGPETRTEEWRNQQ